MKVLDVGCGAGDVSLIAAELVGEEGFVLGVDANPAALRVAQEYDLTTPMDQYLLPFPLWEQAKIRCMEAMRRLGLELRMGMKLYGTFLAAGLPAPLLRYEAPVGGGPVWQGPELLSDTVRALLPLILQFGIATAEDIGIETLSERLREEIVSGGEAAQLPSLVSAWSHIGEA